MSEIEVFHLNGGSTINYTRVLNGAWKLLNAEEKLKEGLKVLNPFLNESGFSFKFVESGNSSGGFYAWGKYQKANKTIELHYRYSLGCVTYRIDDTELSHENYMKLLGVYGKNK